MADGTGREDRAQEGSRGFAERRVGPGRLAVTLPVYSTDAVEDSIANLDDAYEAFDERIQEEDPQEAAASVAQAATYDADGFYAWCDRRRFRGGYDGHLIQALANALPDPVVLVPRIDTVALPDAARELNRYRMRYQAAREQDAVDDLDAAFLQEKADLEDAVAAEIRDQLGADVSADPSHISPWLMMGREIPDGKTVIFEGAGENARIERLGHRSDGRVMLLDRPEDWRERPAVAPALADGEIFLAAENARDPAPGEEVELEQVFAPSTDGEVTVTTAGEVDLMESLQDDLADQL